MTLLGSLFGDDADVLRDRAFQTLLLANVLPPLGTSLLSPILDSLIDPFGTSAADIGLMVSVFTAPAILIIPVAGVLSDRYGRKPIMVGSLLVFGGAGAAISLTTDFRVVLGLRLVQGVGFAGLTPIIITSLGDVYEGTREATAQGIRFTGTGLTQAFFPLVAGVLVVLGWQFPFLIYAIAFPIALVVFVWFEEPTASDPPATARADGGAGPSRLRALARLVRQRRVAALLLARSLPVSIWIGFATYNSIVVVRLLDGTPAQAGLLVAINALTFATAASQTGRITAMFESRYYPLIGANVCLGLGFATFLFAPALPVAAVGIVVFGVGFGLALAIYRSVITGLATQALRGGLVSLGESLGRVVATATPIGMGAVIAAATPQVGLAAAVQLAGLGVAAVAGGGGVLFLFLARTAPAIDLDG